MNFYKQVIPKRKLTVSEDNELSKKASDGDEVAKNMLFTYHLRDVMKQAEHFAEKAEQIDDLFNAGATALWHAINKFKYEGSPIWSYAYFGVFRAMQQEQGRFNPIASTLYTSEARKVKKLLKDGDMPPEAVRKSLNVHLGDNAINVLREVEYINGSTADKLTHDFKEFSTSDQQSRDERLDRQELCAALEEALNTLTEREKNILLHRYGFVDGEEWTLEQIGKMQGVTRSRIRQIEAKALRKLRHPSRAYLIEIYKED